MGTMWVAVLTASGRTAFATTYLKNLPGGTEGHAHGLPRTIKHPAEHSRDFAAVREIADVHDGVARESIK
jgi:hypothetical protein